MSFVPQFDPTLTLAQLLGSNGLEQGEAFTWLANQLANTSPPFPVAGWQSNGLYVQQLQAIAAELSLTNDVISSLAGTCSVALAPGNPPGTSLANLTNATWLDLTAWCRYRVQRAMATQGTYFVLLTTEAGKGPYSVPASSLWFADPTGVYAYQSQNTGSVQLTSAEPVGMLVRAQVAGSAPNVIAGVGVDLSMITPLLGVTAATFSPSGGTSSAQVTGTDTQSDASVIVECQTQWATISPVATQSTIVHWAIEASKASGFGLVTDVAFEEGTALSPGDFNVYIATSAGAASSDLVSAVQNGVGTVPGVTQLQPELTTGTVISAGAYGVAVYATIYVPAAQIATCTAEVVAAFGAYQASMQISDGLTRGTVYYSDVLAICQNLDSQTGSAARNVESLTLNGTTSDVLPATIGVYDVAVIQITHSISGPPVSNLTFVGV